MPEIDDSFSARLNLAINALGGPARPLSRTLALHLGPASQASAEAALANVPASTLLLYLCLPGSAPLDPATRRDLAAKGVLAEDFDMSGFLRERFFACIEATRAFNAKLSGEKEPPKEFLLWIQTTLSDGFEKRNDRMRTLQTRIRCALANFPCIAGHGRLEMPTFDPSIPVVVCGAGPSIKGQLEILRDAQGRAMIVCAGRAVKMLNDAGISPDYVVDIEQKAQLYWPEGLRLSGVLVAHESISPVVAGSFSKYIWTDCGLNPLRGLFASSGISLPSIPANGPVASVMIGFAVSCGARRIALCGYDLSIGADGKSYADGKGSMNKDSAKELKVPSVAGGLVDTLPQFEAMRRDVQASIDILRKAGMLFEIYNCSPSGAVIAGTMPMTVDGFMQSYAKSPKSALDVFASTGRDPEGSLNKALQSSIKAQDAVYKLSKNIAKIDEELSGQRPDISQVQRLEKRMEEFFKEELATRAGPDASELSVGAFEQARLISEQWPRFKPQGELEARRFHSRMLLRQCLLHEGFLKDSIQELREILKARAEARELSIDIHKHPALREHAVRIIRQQNHELALRLEHTLSDDEPEGFEIFHMLLSPPIVLSMTGPSGQTIPLADASSYTEQIQGATSGLIKDSAFDPAQDAIILSGHVNWGLATEIAFRHPGTRMLLVFPWIDLLSHMADTCEFMGLLPEGTLLVCPSEQCQDWRKLLEARIALWKRSVRRILLFENEATSSLPELQESRGAIKSFLS